MRILASMVSGIRFYLAVEHESEMLLLMWSFGAVMLGGPLGSDLPCLVWHRVLLLLMTTLQT